MRRPLRSLTSLALVASSVVVVHGVTGASPPAHGRLDVTVVSSSADQVTGGDARLHVNVPPSVDPDTVAVLVNGDDQRDRFTLLPGTRTLTGVVDGLVLGDNTVEVRRDGPGRGVPPHQRLALTNHPITGPVFSGPHQYPFVCNTVSQGLGQPIVDDPVTGTRVLDGGGELVGYSRDCSVETRVDFRYLTTSGQWVAHTPGVLPGDAETITDANGDDVPLVVRWERGTVNRFLYSIATPVPYDAGPWDLATDVWNGAVVYRFDGGVAIGHTQGSFTSSGTLYTDGLRRGYSVIYSTGNRTNTHYNLQLGGETALMVKERFIERFDVPRYTVAIGGSGGAIQQYVYAQNHPGLLDAGIPQMSYPDMVTQAVHVGDCELLEHYMDVLDAGNARWATWSNRTLLEGMAASDSIPNPYFGGAPGNTECINGWRGLSPLALNPLFGAVTNQANFEPQSAIAEIEWTHFSDIVNIVGVADDGYARNYWDNVGVQYGLRSVAEGAITPEEFLKLNGSVGGWKNEPDMVQEGQPFVPVGGFDPWSRRNQVFSTDPLAAPAPRTEGDVDAMNAVYEAGLVFRGDIDIPIIDVRAYLEPFLDMHNSHQSFAARQRMLNADGDASNQLIWFTDATPAFADITPVALDLIDEWMRNIAAHPHRSVAANAPAGAVDRCFEPTGTEIAAGPDVWAGILDDGPAGACTERFPIFSTSRQVAGGPIEQSYFKCALIPVSQAIEQGFYGAWSPTAEQRQDLERIFPTGVCDYGQPDQGLPVGWR